MFRITKRVLVEAAHQLTKMPDGHQCAQLHGHSYVIDVELIAAHLDENGFVVDYGELSAAVKKYDHKFLNDFPEFKQQPTAEMFALVIADEINRVVLEPINRDTDPALQVYIVSVRVQETASSSATWENQRAAQFLRGEIA